MTLVDRYLLGDCWRRLLVALGVVLLALVLERLLRLFEFAAENEGAFGLVLQMAVNLVPHYLGMALPAAFFISILLLVARLSDDNEIDVLLGAGLSISRIARPLVLGAVALAVFSILLQGYLQPYSRYAYRAIRHEATHAVWDGSVPPQTFITPEEGLTLYADEAAAAGQRLRGVFVNQRQESGREITTTATSGRVHRDFEVGRAYLVLEDGIQLITRPGREPITVHFETLTLSRDFPLSPPPYRPRGEDARELTLLELWRGDAAGPVSPTDSPEPIEHSELIAESHARLVRSMSIVAMPLLAVPMGMAAKRSRRGKAILVGAVILVAYHHALEFGEGLVDYGTLGPLVGLWLPLALFTALCLALFRRANRQPGQSPFDAVFRRLDDLLDGLAAPLRRLRRRFS